MLQGQTPLQLVGAQETDPLIDTPSMTTAFCFSLQDSDLFEEVVVTFPGEDQPLSDAEQGETCLEAEQRDEVDICLLDSSDTEATWDSSAEEGGSGMGNKLRGYR
uniref:Uncharacterized protein n=1 Tax=Sphaerodactylus townsendi TaxID=933632 RepID=A0ACB8EV71_9SAUR